LALQTARLGTIKTLAGYDFSFPPGLDRDRIMALNSQAPLIHVIVLKAASAPRSTVY
jgi:hypothetical protein